MVRGLRAVRSALARSLLLEAGELEERVGARVQTRPVAAGLVITALVYEEFALANGTDRRWLAVEGAGVALFGGFTALGYHALGPLARPRLGAARALGRGASRNRRGRNVRARFLRVALRQLRRERGRLPGVAPPRRTCDADEAGRWPKFAFVFGSWFYS